MKNLILGLVFLALVSIAWPAQAEVYTPMAGDLIKTASSPAIYLVDDNLKRHLFSNEATFWTWYSGGWSAQKVKIITQDEFDVLDESKHVTARPGTNLVQIDNSNKVYAVTPGGVLCEVRALYGDNWQTRIIKIQSSFEIDYVRDNSCILVSGGVLPDGSLIQYLKSKDVYYITAGTKVKVSADGMIANGFKDSSIIKDVGTYMVYPNGKKAITNYDPTLSILYSLTYSRNQEIQNRPDLIITDIVFPTARIVVNQTVDIRLVIKNIGGNLTSEVGLRNLLFSSSDWSTASISHADYPTANNPLQTGQTFEITYRGRFVSSGEKNFTAKVDEPSELVELNEQNNSYSEKITAYAQ
jgi:hypothetical protein